MTTQREAEHKTNTDATKRLVLSFEAGGDPQVAGQMLDVLRQEGARASIFVLGVWAEANPDLIRRMADEGHELGNHSYSHPDLTQLDAAQIREELRSTNTLVEQLSGQRAFPWLRPPYGAVNDRLRRVAQEEGYRLILRDAIDGGHWPGETTSDSIVQRTLDNAYGGAVLTFHIHSLKTRQMLPTLIQRLRAQGCEFGRLAELPAINEYAERRADSRDIALDPGFLQVLQAGTRAWSMDLLEYGTRQTVPTQQPLRLAETERYALNLVSGAADEDALTLPFSASDRHLLLIDGAAEYLFRDEGEEQPRLRILARPNYVVLWPKGYEVSIQAQGQAWLLLILE